nr:Uncharacterised protein [Raoultella sp. NCTC 9187]
MTGRCHRRSAAERELKVLDVNIYRHHCQSPQHIITSCASRALQRSAWFHSFSRKMPRPGERFCARFLLFGYAKISAGW